MGENMSYCRFENTLRDLEDCQANIDDNDLSETEEDARKKLIERCVEIALEYGHTINIAVQREGGCC